MGNCLYCKGKTYGSFKFCKACQNLKDDGIIIKCEKCKNWHKKFEPCECANVLNSIKKVFYTPKETENNQYKKEQPLKNIQCDYIKKQNIESEINFRKKLEKVIDNKKYCIETQRSLRQLVEKKFDKWKWANNLNKVVDFVIVDKNNNYNVELIIEYNDLSHNQLKRIQRDEELRKILTEANYKFIFLIRDDSFNTHELKKIVDYYLTKK